MLNTDSFNQSIVASMDVTDNIVFLTHKYQHSVTITIITHCTQAILVFAADHGHKVVKHAISTAMKSFRLLKQNTVYMK